MYYKAISMRNTFRHWPTPVSITQNQEKMNTEKFIDTVKRMREAQREYSKTRNRKVMLHSMMLEGAVDKMIQEHEEWLKAHPVQKDLFESEE